MARKKKKVEEVITDVVEEIIDTPITEQGITQVNEVKSEPKKENKVRIETSEVQKPIIKKFKAQNLSDFLY